MKDAKSKRKPTRQERFNVYEWMSEWITNDTRHTHTPTYPSTPTISLKDQGLTRKVIKARGVKGVLQSYVVWTWQICTHEFSESPLDDLTVQGQGNHNCCTDGRESHKVPPLADSYWQLMAEGGSVFSRKASMGKSVFQWMACTYTGDTTRLSG